MECAQSLGMKTLRDGGSTDQERLIFLFRRCVSRAPSEHEQAALLRLLQKETESFSNPDAKPWDLVTFDATQANMLPNTATPAQAAAWIAVARVALNLDETITRE
jgi:hypothetical protein